ncbi:unnamed protein product [Lactuca saligna]|uniref:Uncharacterized protein n=1 Tax=Lactuca saligna TaxID=75948 RepID=A0AA36EMA1_LACSI|nr:unnamed protein product [Lactuca saligna]
MFCDVPATRKILESDRTLTPSGFSPMTVEFQAILVVVEKGKKGGRGSKKATKKDAAKEGSSEGAKTPSKKRKAPVASTDAPKRRKQNAKRRKYPISSPSQSEGERSESDSESEIHIEENHPVCTEDQGPVRNEEDKHVHNEPAILTKVPSQNHEVTPPLNDYVPSPPPSPKITTSTPITIASCHPPVSSQPPTSITVLVPIFTESTIPPKASTAPISSINISDMGANTSGFSRHVTPSISLIHTDDLYMIFGDDEDDMGRFTYSPFQFRIDSEDEASATKGELKSHHDKIDQLILASKASSSETYSKEAVESILERVIKEHATNASTMTKNTYDSSTFTANKAIQNVSAIFKAERENFVELRKEFQSDNQAFQSSTDAKISKLQEELALERKIMDALAIKEEKSPVNPLVIKKEPKCKEKLFNDEPIIDDEGDEEPDEAELKRRKTCEAELDENAHIVRKAS